MLRLDILHGSCSRAYPPLMTPFLWHCLNALSVFLRKGYCCHESRNPPLYVNIRCLISCLLKHTHSNLISASLPTIHLRASPLLSIAEQISPPTIPSSHTIKRSYIPTHPLPTPALNLSLPLHSIYPLTYPLHCMYLAFSFYKVLSSPCITLIPTDSR